MKSILIICDEFMHMHIYIYMTPTVDIIMVILELNYIIYYLLLYNMH